MPTLGEKARRLESYWSLANLLWTAAIAGGSLMLGWLAAAIAWTEGTIKPFGTLGYIVTTLVVAVLLGGIFLAISAGVWFWRRGKPKLDDRISPANSAHSSELGLRADEQSDEPEKEVDPTLYNKLVAFSLDYLMPACEARMELNDAMLGRGVENAKIREMVYSSFWADSNAASFFASYCKIHEGLYSTVGRIIRFHSLVEHIGTLERTYKAVVDQGDELATEMGVGFLRDLPEQFDKWCQQHRALRDAYEPIKRDSRISALFRPGKPSRWGDAP